MLNEELQRLEKRVDLIKQAVNHTHKKLSIHQANKDHEPEKRMVSGRSHLSRLFSACRHCLLHCVIVLYKLATDDLHRVSITFCVLSLF